jgi:hypothetical protein
VICRSIPPNADSTGNSNAQPKSDSTSNTKSTPPPKSDANAQPKSDPTSNTKSSGTQSRFTFPTARDLGDPIVDDGNPFTDMDEKMAKICAQNDALTDCNPTVNYGENGPNTHQLKKCEVLRQEILSKMSSSSRKKFFRREKKEFDRRAKEYLNESVASGKYDKFNTEKTGKTGKRRAYGSKKIVKDRKCTACTKMFSSDVETGAGCSHCQKMWCDSCTQSAINGKQLHICGQCLVQISRMQTCDECAEKMYKDCGYCSSCSRFTCVNCHHDCDTNYPAEHF